MRMQLQPYDLTITYKRGKDMHVADALSRNFIAGSKQSVTECEGEIADINQLEYVPAKGSFLHKIRAETQKDPAL